MNLNQANIIEVLALASRTSTVTPASGIDISQYDGPACLILQSTAATSGTNPTLNVKLQHSHEANANFEDVTGKAFNEVTDAADLTQMLNLQLGDLRKYIRVVGTIGGTATPTYAFGVSMVATRHDGRNASQEV